MACKDKCRHFEGYRGRATYTDGYVFCRVCAASFKWEGLHCPCCSFRVRRRPHPSKAVRMATLKQQRIDQRTRRPVRPCAICGEPYQPRFTHQRYCSPPCKKEALARQNRLRNSMMVEVPA